MKTILIIICFLFQMIGTEAQGILPPIKFEKGNAAVSGTVKSDKAKEQLTLRVVVKSPFKEQPDFYSTTINKDGSFFLNIPMETNNALGSIAITGDSSPYVLGVVGLSQAKMTHLNVTVQYSKVTSQVSDILGITSKERQDFGQALMSFDTASPELTGLDSRYYQLSLTDYVKLQMDSILPKRVHYTLEPYSFSPGLKDFLTNSLMIHYVSGRMFFYRQDAQKHYRKTVQEPPLSYYSFLQRLTLNPEQSLYDVYFYPQFMSRLLKVPAFGIAQIADTPVKTWVDSVKNKIGKAIGSQTQSFYDVLALYAYLNDYKTLSERQRDNISTYYTGTNKDMGMALLNHYTLMDSIYNRTESHLHINKTPQVKDSEILNSILSKYKGKTVLVDIWGTWCQPCLIAHKAMTSIKTGLKNKGIVFVYLADTSSPRQQWLDKVKEIGDEHYYLTKKQMSVIFNHYKEVSNPYPFYLIFDKDHKLKQKFTGFPGTKVIEQALLK